MSDTPLGYVQLFVYKIPDKNLDAMHRVLKEIGEMLKRHGALYSEFYRLYSPEAFQGFTSISKTLLKRPDEQLWVELDHYHSREERDRAMLEIGKDTSASPLFRQLGSLVSEAYSIIMGELDMIRM